MNVPMRKPQRAMSLKEAEAVVNTCKDGVLCLCADQEPYGVPINYAREGNCLYFHCAAEGRKIRMMQQNPNACLTLIAQDTIAPELFTCKFASVMVFGTLHPVDDLAQKQRALQLLCDKYCSSVDPSIVHQKVMDGAAYTQILCLEIETITGKKSKYLF